MRLALLVTICCSSVLADQVILKNGDRVSGVIVKKDGKSLTIKTEFFGTVTTPWEQVQELKTDQPVNVELQGGNIVQGTVQVKEGRVEVAAPDSRRDVSVGDVVALRDTAEQRTYDRLLRPGWMDLWAGGATLGFAGTKGNAETSTFTAGFNAARVTRTDKTTLYFNAIRASAKLAGIEAGTARAVRGGWAYNRNIAKRLFVTGFNDYEYDRFQNLDLRFVLGGGLGYMLWKGERGRFDLLSGVAYNRESFSPPLPLVAFTRNSAEAYFGDDFTYKLNTRTSLYQNARYFANLSNAGEYRFNFDTGANTQLLRWLTWNLALSNRYLSNPVPGRKTNDFLYTTGIGVTFAR